MRSLQLQAALTEHIEAVAVQLHAEIAGGAEVPFELEQQSRPRGSAGPAFCCYRPLTDQFIEQRMSALAQLPTHAEAARMLAEFDGLERYLASFGSDYPASPRHASVSAGLSALVSDVFAEQTDFQLRPERLDTALERLERAALSATSELTLVATLHGLTITSPELALARGLTIAQPHALEGLPAGAVAPAEDDGRHLVVVLAAEQRDHREALEEGRGVLKDLQRALRLFGDGRVTLGLLAWARVGNGAWSVVPLGSGGRPHGMLVVKPEQEDELRAFCNLVSRRAPHENELAWALRRFELGCERTSAYEALTDHLLALRALLEPEGSAGEMLSSRLAALCATPERRQQLIERTGQALALERSLITGAAVEHAAAAALANDMADHLRALLRDVICGHLDANLVALADELLLASIPELDVAGEPGELDAAVALEMQAQPELAGERDEEAEPDAAVTHSSVEEMLGDPSQAQEILDVFI
jgi:hypothetical protein